MVELAATRITAPSPISAVLSATATSSDGGKLAEMVGQRRNHSRPARGERLRSVSPSSKRSRRRTIRARTRHRQKRAGGFDVAEDGAGRFRARFGAAASGGLAERLRVAHERAQVGVFPVLDAPVRQALAGEQHRTRRHADWQSRHAGQPRARLRKFVRQRRFGGRLYDFHFSHGIHFVERPYAAASC